jgi:putative transposase
MTIKGFKYRIYPNATQERELDFMLWQLRKIWNRGLGIRRWMYKRTGDDLQGSRMKKHFSRTLRDRHPDTYGVLPYDTVGYVFDNMDEAYKRFHRNLRSGIHVSKAGKPRFKRRGEEPGLYLRNGVSLIHPKSGKRINAVRYGGKKVHPLFAESSPFVGDNVEHKGAYLHVSYLSNPCVRIHFHRGFPPNFDSSEYATITRDRGQWFISFTVKDTNPEPVRFVPNPDTALGIDVGLRYLISSSDGRQEPHRHWYKVGLPELRRLQRKLDRQRRANNPQNYDNKGRVVPREQRKEWCISGNMRRTEKAVAQEAKRVQDQRRYFWETYTDDITKQWSIIAIENLTAKFMLSNKKLSRLSADAALSFFRTRLEHKCRERGVMLIRVRPAYTSQQCNACGYTSGDNRLTQSQFVCCECGHTANADLNAAHNIRDRGLHECEKADTFLRDNPDVLREIAEAKSAKRTCESYLKESGVHHWTTLSQVAEWICSA